MRAASASVLVSHHYLRIPHPALVPISAPRTRHSSPSPHPVPGTRPSMADAQSDLLRSSLDLLILKALSWGPMHGYGVSEWIDGASESVLLLEEGTLYPALHRLERRGWIASEWGVSDNNRRAKFYKLTTAGRARFRAESPIWHRHAKAIAAALGRKSPEPT